MTQCPVCRREVAFDGAVFCPYCAAALDREQREVPEEVQALVKRVQECKDPVQKHRLLTEALQKYPDSLDLAQEQLFLGRLYERSSKKLDFSVIKCYLWHMYLTPESFSAETKNAMREELVNHPHLVRCLQLSGDADAFMRTYLRRLAAEFVTMFLLGSTHYTKTVFGFRWDNRMGRVLAQPAAQMLERIWRDEALGDHREAVYQALYRAFAAETGGETRWVDELLQKQDCPIPRMG